MSKSVPGDSSKNINQNTFNIRIMIHNLKRRNNLLIRGPAPNIKKVSRPSPIHTNQIHSSHGQSCAIDHTPNIPIQRNIVEVIAFGLNLLPVLLGEVLHHEDLLLTEGGVVVDVYLVVADYHLALDGYA
jgi:hypothetical protein